MSTYIYDRAPHLYGSQQLDYENRVKDIIEKASHAFHTAITQNEDLLQLFHTTLADFATQRYRIAQLHSTNDTSSFGVRRDQSAFSGSCSLTSLGHPYIEYSERLKALFTRYFLPKGLRNNNLNDSAAPKPRDLNIESDPILQYGGTFDLPIAGAFAQPNRLNCCCTDPKATISNTFPAHATSAEIPAAIECSTITDSTTAFFSGTNYKNLCILSGKRELAKGPKDFGSLLKNKAAMETLKQNSYVDYEKARVLNAIMDIEQCKKYLGPAEIKVVSISLTIEGRMRPLSKYIWLPSRTVHVTILHQDPFCIQESLDAIAKIFKRALEWQNREDVGVLKRDVALIEYMLAHAMPYKRGSAAISEWLEMTIYRYHGFQLNYNREKMVNLEALSSLYPEFVANYDSMVQLHRFQT